MIFYPSVKDRYWSLTRRIFVIMKLVVIFLFIAMLQVHAKGTAQTINLKVKNLTLTEAMRSIQKQSGYAFFLNVKAIAITRVSAEIENETLDAAMGKLLEPLNLEWVIKDETIVVKRRRTKKSGDELALSAPLQRRVTGRITDGQGTPLIGATITIKGEA